MMISHLKPQFCRLKFLPPKFPTSTPNSPTHHLIIKPPHPKILTLFSPSPLPTATAGPTRRLSSASPMTSSSTPTPTSTSPTSSSLHSPMTCPPVGPPPLQPTPPDQTRIRDPQRLRRAGPTTGGACRFDAAFFENLGFGSGGRGGGHGHKRSGSMDEGDSSTATSSDYVKKAMAAEKLAELSLIDPKRAKRFSGLFSSSSGLYSSCSTASSNLFSSSIDTALFSSSIDRFSSLLHVPDNSHLMRHLQFLLELSVLQASKVHGSIDRASGYSSGPDT